MKPNKIMNKIVLSLCMVAMTSEFSLASHDIINQGAFVVGISVPLVAAWTGWKAYTLRLENEEKAEEFKNSFTSQQIEQLDKEYKPSHTFTGVWLAGLIGGLSTAVTTALHERDEKAIVPFIIGSSTIVLAILSVAHHLEAQNTKALRSAINMVNKNAAAASSVALVDKK